MTSPKLVWICLVLGLSTICYAKRRHIYEDDIAFLKKIIDEWDAAEPFKYFLDGYVSNEWGKNVFKFVYESTEHNICHARIAINRDKRLEKDINCEDDLYGSQGHEDPDDESWEGYEAPYDRRRYWKRIYDSKWIEKSFGDTPYDEVINITVVAPPKDRRKV